MNDRIEDRVANFKAHPSKPYCIRYRLEFGHFGREDVTDVETGLTQDAIMISCITQPDGGYSQNWMARDGLTQGYMHSQDVFKAWILMAQSLAEKKDLNPASKELCRVAFEMWRGIMMS